MITQEVEDDLSNAWLHVKREGGDFIFNKYCPIYSSTTENIKGYYDFIEFKDKKVLSVCSSGDHVFNAILKGTESIDTFDINKFTKYYLYLKKAALLSLSSTDYIDFFIKGNDEKLFNKNTYIKIREKLDPNSKYFWDILFTEKKNIRNTNLFNMAEDSRTTILERNEYLKEESYNFVKKKLSEINIPYYNTDIIDIPHLIRKKYDIILLSNISDYLSLIFSDNRLEKYKNFIVNNLSKNLNKNGIIVSSYIYDYRETENIYTYLEINNPKLRKNVFNSSSFSTYKFNSNNTKKKEDAVIIYKKTYKKD